MRPLRLGRPILGLSKKPGLTLIAKPSKPGMYAVFTSTSPWASGMSMERIGGMITLPLAKARNACSTTSTAARSRCTQARRSRSVSTKMSRMPLSPDYLIAERHRPAAGDGQELVRIDIAAADDNGAGPIELELTGDQRSRSDRSGALDGGLLV